MLGNRRFIDALSLLPAMFIGIGSSIGGAVLGGAAGVAGGLARGLGGGFKQLKTTGEKGSKGNKKNKGGSSIFLNVFQLTQIFSIH